MVVMATANTPVRTATTSRASSTAGGTDSLRRKELAAFLRSRRERVTPEQVGLPTYGRRRTPGLRRADADARRSGAVTSLHAGREPVGRGGEDLPRRTRDRADRACLSALPAAI